MNIVALAVVIGAVAAAVWRALELAATRRRDGAIRALLGALATLVMALVLGVPVILAHPDRLGLSGVTYAVLLSLPAAVAIVWATGQLAGPARFPR
jgi:hypothetical protein